MNRNKQTTLIKTFDLLAKTYTNKFTFDQLEKERLLSLISLWHIKENSTALEVGGGTGDLTPFLLKEIKPNGQLIFLDISPKMIEVAKTKLRKFKNIEFVTGDIHTFKSKKKVDTILIFNTFPHLFDKKTAFRNCHEMLKPGGKLIICHNESRMSICLHHVKKAVSLSISDFPEDDEVHNLLVTSGFTVNLFENNEGWNYYLVIASK